MSYGYPQNPAPRRGGKGAGGLLMLVVTGVALMMFMRSPPREKNPTPPGGHAPAPREITQDVDRFPDLPVNPGTNRAKGGFEMEEVVTVPNKKSKPSGSNDFQVPAGQQNDKVSKGDWALEDVEAGTKSNQNSS